jgi:hypothetical protein
LSYVEQSDQRGHDLQQKPLVGIGTMCHRRRTREAMETLSRLAREGLRLHGFGMKTGALHQDVTELWASAEVHRSAPALAASPATLAGSITSEWRTQL